jgi:Ulp1 family protease
MSSPVDSQHSVVDVVPIKVRTHWLLAALYPVSLGGAKGRVKVYNSHPNWTSIVLQFLKSRLAREFDPADWILVSQQYSQPQQNDADSGLYLLANAKSIALSLAMVHLDSDAQRMDLRWQIAEELVTRSIVGGF